MGAGRLSPRDLVRFAGLAGAAAAAAYVYKGAQFRRAAAQVLTFADPPAPGTPAFACLLEALTKAPVRQGNAVTILRNGCEIFPALIDSVGSAKETINFSTYIWWSGDAAQEMAEAFARRAREGLEVRVLLDAWGSAKLDRAVVQTLRHAGVEVVWFRPPRWYELGKANKRMHRRILVIDGRVGFTGGVGVAADWEGNCERPELWRETHLRIEGPAVRDILGGFLENWAEATHRVLAVHHLPDLEPVVGGVPVLVTRSSASSGSTTVEQLYLAGIAGARQRLWITTAYFAPGAGFVDALCSAAGRGVDVRVLVNGRPIDKEVVRKAGRHSYGALLQAGVRIFEYEKARLHAKVIVVDDTWANVGSANFDNRSISLEDEINVSIDDAEVVSTLAAHFLDDMDSAREVTFEQWRRRPLWERWGEAASEVVRHSL
jgi:cardiolipin synthase